MSRFFRLLFLLLFCSISAGYAQERIYPDYNSSSGFELDSLDARNPLVLDNLETLARVWGFVKYHHPIMADTTIHIDYELFGLLPRVAHAETAERNRILTEWIDGFGSYEIDTTDYSAALSGIEHLFVNDFSWISDTIRLGGRLSHALTNLHQAVVNNNRYVFQQRGTIGLYDDWFWSYDYNHPYDTGFRLLILFRFWNAIDSYCPNRNLTDTPWNEVLNKYIPRMILDSDSYVLTQLELYSELNDTHAFGPYTAIFGSKRIPVVARMVEGRLIVTDSYKMNGVLPGDEIVKISGRTIPEVIARVKKYTAQSNESVLLGKVADYAFWTSKDSVNLTCLRESRQWQTTVPSRAISDVYQEMNKKDLLREPWRLLNDSVAYMYIGTFQAKDAPQVYEKIKDTKALIVDMRGYPSDHSIISEFFQPYFVPVPVPYVKMLVPLWNFPGLFYRSPISPLGKLEQEDVNDPNSWRLVENPNAYKGKLVILVDESTISASEHYTMILQAIPNSVTVGSQTAGADGDVVRIAMPGWMDVGFSSIKVLYPDGTDTQRVGVRVDHEVKPTVEGVITGRDEVLEYALQLINEI